MTIVRHSSYQDYLGNGRSKEYDFDFQILRTEDVFVSIDNVEIDKDDYTVIKNDALNGGRVVFNKAVVKDSAIRIFRRTVAEQTLSLSPTTRIPSDGLEEGLDKGILIDQEIIDNVESIKRVQTLQEDPSVSNWARTGNKELIPENKLTNIRYGNGSILPQDNLVYDVFYLSDPKGVYFWDGEKWAKLPIEVSDVESFISKFDSGPELPPVSVDIENLKAFLVRNNGVNALYSFNNPPDEDLYNSLITAIAEKEITGLRGLTGVSSSISGSSIELGLTAAGGLLVAGDDNADASYVREYDDFDNPVFLDASSVSSYPFVSFVANNIVFHFVHTGSGRQDKYKVGTSLSNLSDNKTLPSPGVFNLSGFFKNMSVFNNNKLLRLYRQDIHAAFLIYSFDETEREFVFDRKIENIDFSPDFAFSDGVNIFVSDPTSSSNASFKGYHLSSGLRNSDVDFSVNVGNRTVVGGNIILGQLFLVCYDNKDDTFYSVAAFQLGKKLGWELVNDNFLTKEVNNNGGAKVSSNDGKPDDSVGQDGDVTYDKEGKVTYLKIDGKWRVSNNIETRKYYQVGNSADVYPPILANINDAASTIVANGWKKEIPEYEANKYLYYINVLVDAFENILHVATRIPLLSHDWNGGGGTVIKNVTGNITWDITSIYNSNETAIRLRNLPLIVDFDSFYGIYIYIRDYSNDPNEPGDIQEPKFFRSSDLRVSTAARTYSFECQYVRGGSLASMHFRLTSKRNIQITAVGTYPATEDEHPTIYEIVGVNFANQGQGAKSGFKELLDTHKLESDPVLEDGFYFGLKTINSSGHPNDIKEINIPFGINVKTNSSGTKKSLSLNYLTNYGNEHWFQEYIIASKTYSAWDKVLLGIHELSLNVQKRLMPEGIEHLDDNISLNDVDRTGFYFGYFDRNDKKHAVNSPDIFFVYNKDSVDNTKIIQEVIYHFQKRTFLREETKSTKVWSAFEEIKIKSAATDFAKIQEANIAKNTLAIEEIKDNISLINYVDNGVGESESSYLVEMGLYNAGTFEAFHSENLKDLLNALKINVTGIKSGKDFELNIKSEWNNPNTKFRVLNNDYHSFEEIKSFFIGGKVSGAAYNIFAAMVNKNDQNINITDLGSGLTNLNPGTTFVLHGLQTAVEKAVFETDLSALMRLEGTSQTLFRVLFAIKGILEASSSLKTAGPHSRMSWQLAIRFKNGLANQPVITNNNELSLDYLDDSVNNASHKIALVNKSGLPYLLNELVIPKIKTVGFVDTPASYKLPSENVNSLRFSPSILQIPIGTLPRGTIELINATLVGEFA